MAAQPRQSFLAPGQRDACAGCPAWRTDSQLTILAVDQDRSGLVWATFRGPHGGDSTVLSTQLERAVAGEIVPVSDDQIIRCGPPHSHKATSWTRRENLTFI